MSTHGSCSNTEDGQMGVENSERSSHNLPFPIHLSLGMLCLWRPSRPMIRMRSVRRWALEYERSELGDGENNNIQDNTITATTHGGRRHLEENVGVKTDYISEAEVWSPTTSKTNKPDHQRLCITDFVFIPIMLSLLVWYAVDMYYYIYATWGQSKFVLDTLSYLCFISQTLSIVAYAVFIRLSICLRIFCRKSRKVQTLPLEMEFIGNRVELIQQNHGSAGYSGKDCLKIPQLIFFLSSPLLNAVFKIAFEIFVSPPTCQFALQHFNNAVASLCFLCYGCFWYLVYVQRVSLHCQLNEAMDKIRELALEGDTEGTRRLIDRVYSEFHVIRKFTGLCMAFTLFSVTILVISCVVFSYQDAIPADAVADAVDSQESSKPWKETLLTLMLWAQNLMFFIVPWCAVGGANLEYMWHRFRHVLTKCKIKDQLEFWREVQTYVAQIDTLGTPALQWTWAFPLLGAMLSNALAQKDHRSLEYWYYRYDCNETQQNISDVFE